MAFGTIAKQYVSSINFLDQREILNQVLDITNEEMALLDMMETMGRMVETGNVTYHNFTNRELYQTYTIETGGVTDNSGGSGQGDVTLTLTSADGLPRVGDLVMFESKYAGYVYARNVATPSISVKAVNATVTTANLNLAQADVFTVFSNAQGEGSDTPDPMRFALDKHYNQVQIFKNSYKITDIERANRIEVNFKGQPHYMYKAQHDAFLRFRGDIEFALMFGQLSTTNFTESSPNLVDGSSNPVQTTRGLDEYITTDGINKNGITFDLDYYKSLVRDFAAARCPKEYFVFQGVEGRIAHDDFLNALTNAASFSPNARIQVNGKELDLGIDTFKYGGYTFYLKHVPLLDHKNVVSFTGSAGFQNRSYYVPTGKVKVHADTGEVDRIRCRFMQDPDATGPYLETLHGRLAPTANSTVDTFQVIYSSIMGLECLGVEHFAQATLA